MRMPLILRALDLPLRCLVLMTAVAPLAVSRTVVPPTWDDAFYLGRAACVSRATYELSFEGIHHCLRAMFKSPVMAVLLLPAGPMTGGIGELGIPPFVLACATFGLAIWLAWITFKANVPFLAVAAAAVAIARCGPIREAGAPFLVDGVFALLVTITTLLPILEYAAPAIEPRAAMSRGLLWGGIAGLGALSKVSFGLFGVAVTPLILAASWWRAGAKSTLYKTAMAALMLVIPGLMFVLYGSMYLSNGWRSAYGDLAGYYDDGLSTWQFLRQNVGTTGRAFWIIVGALFLAALGRGRRDLPRLLLGIAIIALALAYLLLASGSLNRQARFLWPIWLVLPLAAATAIAPWHENREPRARLFLASVCAAAVVWSLPMMSRFDLRVVQQADALLRLLKTDHAVRLEVASNPPLFNIDTLLLAQQVNWDYLQLIDVREVVYDVTRGKTPEYSEQQLRDADFVLIVWPFEVPPTADISNQYIPRFLATARACGWLVANPPGPPNTMLFNMQASPCKASESKSE